MIRSHVLICGGTGCTSSGSMKIISKFSEELAKQGLSDEIKVVQTGCFGLCALGPVVIVYPEGTFYSRVTEEDVPEIVEEHLLKGRLVQRLVYDDIGGALKIKQLRVEKEELLESLEMYYRVFFLGEDVDKEKTEE